jgi:hypothetical protein
VPPTAPFSRGPVFLVLAAAILLAGDIAQLVGSGYAWTVLLAISFAFFAGGLVLLPLAFGPPIGRLLLAGTVLAFPSRRSAVATLHGTAIGR